MKEKRCYFDYKRSMQISVLVDSTDYLEIYFEEFKQQVPQVHVTCCWDKDFLFISALRMAKGIYFL